MTGLAQPLPVIRNLPAAAGATGALALVVLCVLRLGGNTGFPTHPVGALALVGGSVGTAYAASRLAAAGNQRAARHARWLAVALLAYVVTAAWAVWAVAAGSASATIAVASWSSAWIPPLGLMQLTASAAVRTDHRPPWTHRLLAAAIPVLTIANPILSPPAEPFVGLPTIAPEAWRSTLGPLGTVVTLLGVGALLLIPISLWRAALGSQTVARARLGCAAAGATMAPLTVCFCLLLAVARDPGAVDPSLGSVAFLVALCAAGLFSAVCAVLAARGAVESVRPAVALRGAGLAAAALVVLGVGTIIAAPGLGLGATRVAVLVAILTAGVGAGAWAGTGRLASVLAPSAPVEAPVERAAEVAPPSPAADSAGGPHTFPGLTAREAEVLAVLAEGASNAGIAAQLVVSERTVDAHLRSIFVKLGLHQEAETNRRVRAARLWIEYGEAGRRGARERS